LKTNAGIKLKLAALGLAVGLMGPLIVVITLQAQKEAYAARERLSQVDTESFEVAERFRTELRKVNDKARLYASTEDPAAWEEFVRASAQFKTWMELQAPKLVSSQEQELLAHLDVAYKEYMHAAWALHKMMQSDQKTGISLSEYNNFFEHGRRLLDSEEALAKAHFASRGQFLERSNTTWRRLQISVFALVAMLLAFGLALAAVVYQDLIAPLRMRLVESEALAHRREKLAALGMLAAGVAHEIRNPLTALKTALFIQQKKLSPTSPGYSEGEVIQREVVRLERIVTEFLQFARPAKPEPAVIPADQPLREVQALLAPTLAHAGIEVMREAQADGMRILVDPAQIKQVLINLVQNAADSIGRNGKITLRVRSTRQQLNKGETEVAVLEVVDTGKGIAPEIENRLFDPFFTTKDHGTGLGLSIAARMVEINGGSLRYQTQLNHGSTFGVSFPIVTGNETGHLPEPAA
jgi:signal transduction histidine kinase